ncbi:MAG: fibronectin type III domain-containing protein [Candidatus Sumerlaeaceae bacterium]|nr:fibronectin type III domain-containing protein [Candidatus Sumerlaeaceae bacterium]
MSQTIVTTISPNYGFRLRVGNSDLYYARSGQKITVYVTVVFSDYAVGTGISYCDVYIIRTTNNFFVNGMGTSLSNLGTISKRINVQGGKLNGAMYFSFDCTLTTNDGAAPYPVNSCEGIYIPDFGYRPVFAFNGQNPTFNHPNVSISHTHSWKILKPAVSNAHPGTPVVTVRPIIAGGGAPAIEINCSPPDPPDKQSWIYAILSVQSSIASLNVNSAYVLRGVDDAVYRLPAVQATALDYIVASVMLVNEFGSAVQLISDARPIVDVIETIRFLTEMRPSVVRQRQPFELRFLPQNGAILIACPQKTGLCDVTIYQKPRDVGFVSTDAPVVDKDPIAPIAGAKTIQLEINNYFVAINGIDWLNFQAIKADPKTGAIYDCLPGTTEYVELGVFVKPRNASVGRAVYLHRYSLPSPILRRLEFEAPPNPVSELVLTQPSVYNGTCVVAFRRPTITEDDNAALGFRVYTSYGQSLPEYPGTGWTLAQTVPIRFRDPNYTEIVTELTNIRASELLHVAVVCYNEFGESSATRASIDMLGDFSSPPISAPYSLTAESLSDKQIALKWETNCDNADYTIIRRKQVGGTGYVEVARVNPATKSFVDDRLYPSTVYSYVVRHSNRAGESSDSNEATAKTWAAPESINQQGGFVWTPGARVSQRRVGDRLFFFSDLDRGVVFVGGKWFRMGLKPHLTAPTQAASENGGLTGTFCSYICLYRSDDATRSVPGPKSQSITVSAKSITVSPPSSSGKVICRDIGYDRDGREIDGCDYWEWYLWETGSMDFPVMVGRYPLSQPTATTPASLTVAKLQDGSRRPMELAMQSLLPPACAFSEYFASRLWLFGDRNIGPSADQQRIARLAIKNKEKNAQIIGWTPTDAIIHKELIIGGRRTGWFVVDVEGQTIYLKHPDMNIDSSGFESAGGVFSDFAFAGSPGVVYFSAFFGGEALGGATYSPETFPPLNRLEAELDPDDNSLPIAAIASRDALFFAKTNKWVMMTGGNATDEMFWSSVAFNFLSRNSGAIGRKTLAMDRQDVVYYLSDQGLQSVTQAGVRPVGQIAGNAFAFQRFFDVRSIVDAVACWYPRDDYYVCFGLNRIGKIGNKDGFIWDSKTNAILPFSTPVRVTAVLVTQTKDGDYQLLYGDENGGIGVFLCKNIFTDGIDYSRPDSFKQEQAVEFYCCTGVLKPIGNCLKVMWCQPNIKSYNEIGSLAETDASVSIQIDGKNRSGAPGEFTPDVVRSFQSSTTYDKFRLDPKRFQTALIRVSGLSTRHLRVEYRGIKLGVEDCGSSGK